MTNYIFSNTLRFESADARVQVRKIDLAEIKNIRTQAGTEIYLCGGGKLAG
jgi:hypothetical protein